MIHSWGRISLFVLGYSAEASQRALVKRALLLHMTIVASTRIPAIAHMGLTLPVLIPPRPTYFSPSCTVGRMARGPSAKGMQKSNNTSAGCARGPVEWPIRMQALDFDLSLVLTWLQRPSGSTSRILSITWDIRSARWLWGARSKTVLAWRNFNILSSLLEREWENEQKAYQLQGLKLLLGLR